MNNRYFSTLALALLMSQGAIQGASVNENGNSSGEYLLFGKSVFDFSSGTNAYLSGGVPVSYPVRIEFDSNGKAKMEGLLGTRTPFNPVFGNYDSETRTINFMTPLEEITDLDPYTTLDISEDYVTLLCALKPYGIGYIDPIDHLTFTFSEDGRSIYPSSGFGAGAVYHINQVQYILADYLEAIYDAVLVKKESGISFNIDTRKTDIENTFPGMSVKSSFRMFNTGDEASDYAIASSSSNFTISNPSGILLPGEFVDIETIFTADSTGEYNSTITITNEDKDITFDIKAVCVPLPDYSNIVSEGKFDFSTDAKYPWLLSEKYGNSIVAVSSNKGMEMTTSSLYADVIISDRHAGILSWEGHCDPYHPMRDAFVIYVDGEEKYVSENGGGDTAAEIEIAPGAHRIEFAYVKGPLVVGSFATGDDYAWVRNLSLTETELDPYAFRLSTNKINFEPKTIVKKGANASYDIYVRNQGYEALEFIEAISDNEAFSAEIPSSSISTFDIATVKVLFHSFEEGVHNGNVTIHTNAGDIIIKCSGEAVAVPDFSPIVVNGEFDFDTTIEHPFMVDGNKAYNSTSQKKDRKSTSSILMANFEVPNGYYGELTWKARVSSADAYDELSDYATIYIDGEEIYQQFYGEDIDASHINFAPAAVNLYPGEHFVCFAYAQGGDNKFEGDDRIEVSDLSLELKKMNEDEVRIWGSNEARFNDVRITKVYQREIKLANFGTRPLQVTDSKSDGPFIAEIDPTRYYNTLEEIPVLITFIPEKPGVFEGNVVLETSAGDVTIKCYAMVVDDPSILMIEDFEDDMRLWQFIDGDGDDTTWAKTTSPQNAYHGEYALQSFSIHGDFSEGPLDDTAISPEFTVPAEGATLSFYLACYNTSVPDRLAILAGNGDDYESFKLVDDMDLQNVRQYYNKYEISLDDFAGETIRLAFRHAIEKSLMSFIALDDIQVTSKAPNGIDSISIDSREVIDIEYFNIQGLKVENPMSGLFIRRTIYNDGYVVSEKVNLR